MVWTIKQSQLYALLEKLEEENLVSSAIIPGESHPNRKQYSITSLGRQTFTAWRSSPVEHGREIRIEFLAKLFFAMQAGSETTLELVDEQRSRCVEWLNHMDYSLGNIGPDQTYEKAVLQYRISQSQATINWLTALRDETIKKNKTKGNSKG
jgi:DNA-binding PadR family transcriptional regulator